ncbi:hismacro and SEC14 domain-containing protein [Teratosphaeria destructans]|uniref:Hismacro and SEC14 domain-containing protein n=1 Tax=Teratosphaeria destructans TaxID=418781 RepID=A0A9W7W0Y1_9PEZI|nr:hismacro and SEC14 domain-containing protein [Teratosphaeria destructans]
MRTLTRLHRHLSHSPTMSRTLPLTQIPTLTDLYAASHLSPASTTRPNATSKYNAKISLLRADITTLSTDAIVNAANESLLGGGGVDGAIHSAAGPGLLDECRTLDGCDTGDAKITAAYDLPCRKVIHAVGPVYFSAKREGVHARLLRGCYTRSLDLAVENGCRSVAFSCLSTGVYGYPSGEAAETAIGAVKGWLEGNEERAGRMERVVFCAFLGKDQRAYEELLPQFFPPAVAEQADGKVKVEESAATAGADEESEKSLEEGAGEAQVTLPVMPDVPTQEPGEEGQPDAKKVRLSDSEAQRGGGTKTAREVGKVHEAEKVSQEEKVSEAETVGEAENSKA